MSPTVISQGFDTKGTDYSGARLAWQQLSITLQSSNRLLLKNNEHAIQPVRSRRGVAGEYIEIMMLQDILFLKCIWKTMVSTPKCVMKKENYFLKLICASKIIPCRSRRDNSPSCLISPLSNGSSEEGMGWGPSCCYHEHSLLWSTHSTQLVSIICSLFVILVISFKVIS